MRHLALLHESLDEGRHKHMVEVAEEGQGKRGTEVSVGPTTKLSAGEDEGKGGGRGEGGVRRRRGGGGADLRITGRVARWASSSSDLERENIGQSSAKRGAGPSKQCKGGATGGKEWARRGAAKTALVGVLLCRHTRASQPSGLATRMVP
jgi:hypothetical protein